VPEALQSGLIVRAQSGYFTAQTGSGSVTCQLRGRLKQGPRLGDIAAVGDRVTLSTLPDGSGVIEAIAPRKRALVRLDPRPKGIYQQVILANPDQVVFVFDCAQPHPHLRMLDRFLVIAERQDIPAVIVVNKIDLIDDGKAEGLFGHYSSLGYPVIYTSVIEKIGIEDLRERLIGKVSGLAGPSGVGKSSLLNLIQPGLGQVVREVSQSINKGRHATVVRELFALDGGGYLADTPGLRSLALWDTTPEELDGYFPELAPLVAKCQFSNCTHVREPGCAVRAAVEAGKVHPARYDSYLRLRMGDK
jgi:ribosome biogenesis GTPase